MANDNHCRQSSLSRRTFLSAGLAMPLAMQKIPSALAQSAGRRSRSASGPARTSVASPDGHITFEVFLRDQAQLSYAVRFRSGPVIEASAAGITVDAVNLGHAVDIGGTERYGIRETYPCLGVHALANNRANGARISIRNEESKTGYTLEVRVFDDGVAFRYVVPGEGNRVPDEGTAFSIPAGSVVWFHDFEGHYEGIHKRKNISEVQAGEWAAPPLTIKLPSGAGYASITEGALMNYSGMALEADGRRVFKARLGHAEPVSHPFMLRYGAEEAKRLSKPASISGTITTPWRVVMVGADLNALVNCDIVGNVSPPPDKEFFPQGVNTGWLKPGRSVWKYLDGGESTLEGMKEFSRLAGQLGFEYNLVEGFWQRWTQDQMKDLVRYSKSCKVGIWFWKHSRDLRNPESRDKFFTLLNEVGVVGAKIDFFDHEAKEIIDLYQALLRDAARHKILIDFHGANKPAGESRAWPNEMTREAIRGLEYRSMQTRSVHDTTLPFTRMLAGHADYTAMHFGERRRETSWAHQIASAIIFTSPLLVLGAHPRNILENPAVDLIKRVPSVWDETIALPVCEIGEIAAFARRRGKEWFLAIMNGPTPKSLKIKLSFLGKGEYRGMLARDRKNEAGAISIEHVTSRRTDELAVDLRDGGGLVGSFRKGSGNG